MIHVHDSHCDLQTNAALQRSLRRYFSSEPPRKGEHASHITFYKAPYSVLFCLASRVICLVWLQESHNHLSCAGWERFYPKGKQRRTESGNSKGKVYGLKAQLHMHEAWLACNLHNVL